MVWLNSSVSTAPGAIVMCPRSGHLLAQVLGRRVDRELGAAGETAWLAEVARAGDQADVSRWCRDVPDASPDGTAWMPCSGAVHVHVGHALPLKPWVLHGRLGASSITPCRWSANKVEIKPDAQTSAA